MAEMMTLEDNHALWRGKVNNPQDYVDVDPARTHILMELIDACDIPRPSILEIGCNVGRNLDHLRRAGYKKLAGIEISSAVLDRMREQYPAVYKTAEIYNCAVEDIIRDIPTGGFDIVFSMACLMHIHPDSAWIFREIARIAKHNLITIENEEYESSGKMAGLWNPRNYKEVFGAQGMRQIDERSMGEVCKHNKTMAPYIARTFSAIIPPTASCYNRVPQDQRLMRAALTEWKGAMATALYVGPSFGEDFFSWIPVGWGTGTDVHWAALEIDEGAAAAIANHSKVPIEVMVGDFRAGLDREFDFIIANHCWERDGSINSQGLTALLKSNPAMLIARDHKREARHLNKMITTRGYELFFHATGSQPNTANEWPHIFIDPERLPTDYDDRYVALTEAR